MYTHNTDTHAHIHTPTNTHSIHISSSFQVLDRAVSPFDESTLAAIYQAVGDGDASPSSGSASGMLDQPNTVARSSVISFGVTSQSLPSTDSESGVSSHLVAPSVCFSLSPGSAVSTVQFTENSSGVVHQDLLGEAVHSSGLLLPALETVDESPTLEMQSREMLPLSQLDSDAAVLESVDDADFGNLQLRELLPLTDVSLCLLCDYVSTDENAMCEHYLTHANCVD